MSALNLYKSYNFVDKDPVIDLMRGVIAEQRMKYGRISEDSGVSEATLRNWFDGNTRRPQFATVAAVMGALGYRMAWTMEGQPEKTVTLPPARPQPKAQPKAIPVDRQIASAKFVMERARALNAGA
jgi:DNA-binding phage protein